MHNGRPLGTGAECSNFGFGLSYILMGGVISTAARDTNVQLLYARARLWFHPRAATQPPPTRPRRSPLVEPSAPRARVKSEILHQLVVVLVTSSVYPPSMSIKSNELTTVLVSVPYIEWGGGVNNCALYKQCDLFIILAVGYK